MFEIRIRSEFPAGHQLKDYPGDCARPHGHNWVVEAVIRSHHLDSIGMAVDFRILKTRLSDLIGRWDHQNLNDLPEFKGQNPTAENIAKNAYDYLKRTWDFQTHPHVRLAKVTIWENERCSASYFEEV